MITDYFLSTDGYMEFIQLYRNELGIPLGGTKPKFPNKLLKTCEYVLSVSKDDNPLNLPLRVSLTSFKIGLPILSYGCIVRHIDENSNIFYLCLKRSYTNSYIELIRGTYKDSNLYFLLQVLPNTERNYILENYNNFDELWTSHCGKPPGGEPYNHAKKKFSIIQEKISKFLESVKSLDPNGKDLWIWPKGRVDYKLSPDSVLIPESPFECAIREFTEETYGSILDESWALFGDPVCEYYLGSNSKNYCTKYFVFQSPVMFPLSNKDGSNEILTWLPLNDIKNIYSERRVLILDEIEKNISSLEPSCSINSYWKQPIDPSDYLFDYSEN